MTILTYLKNMPAWARWMLYAVIGIFVLNIVQGFDDTSLLTAEGTTRAMLRWGVPILLAGLGGLFAERAGVVNIGLEGMMVLGTWFGAWGALQFGAWWGLADRCTRWRAGRPAARRRHGAVRCRSRDLRRGDQHPRSRVLPGSCRRRSSTKKFKDPGWVHHAIAPSSDGRAVHVPISRRAATCSAGRRPTCSVGSRRRIGSSSPTSRASPAGLTSNMSWVTVFAVAHGSVQRMAAVAHPLRSATAHQRRASRGRRGTGRQHLLLQVRRRDHQRSAGRAWPGRSSPARSCRASTRRARPPGEASSEWPP